MSTNKEIKSKEDALNGIYSIFTKILKAIHENQPMRVDITTVDNEYDKLPSEKVKALESKLEIATEALEFYASFNSWNGNPDYRLEMSIIENEDWDFFEENEEGNCQSYGGKRAREALERIKNANR